MGYKIKEELEEDIPSRIKLTMFEGDKQFVSTVNNKIAGTLSPLAGLRNDMFGMYPYETAFIDETKSLGDRTSVVRHAKTKEGALKNHTQIVNWATSDKKIDWDNEQKKALERLLNKK